jgi:soluble lytic murein transglycosylase-like protein
MMIEEHQRRMRRQAKRFIKIILALAGIFAVVFFYLYYDRGSIIASREIAMKRTIQVNSELGHYQTRDKLLSVLRIKQLSISQGLDVCDVILSQNQVPAAVVLGILEQESQFKADAISSKGARGIAQMMPATFKSYNVNPMIQNLMDPATNIRASINYLAELHAQYGNWKDVLRSYQAGPTNAKNSAFDWYANGVLNRVERFDRELNRESVLMKNG